MRIRGQVWEVWIGYFAIAVHAVSAVRHELGAGEFEKDNVEEARRGEKDTSEGCSGEGDVFAGEGHPADDGDGEDGYDVDGGVAGSARDRRGRGKRGRKERKR